MTPATRAPLTSLKEGEERVVDFRVVVKNSTGTPIGCQDQCLVDACFAEVELAVATFFVGLQCLRGLRLLRCSLYSGACFPLSSWDMDCKRILARAMYCSYHCVQMVLGFTLVSALNGMGYGRISGDGGQEGRHLKKKGYGRWTRFRKARGEGFASLATKENKGYGGEVPPLFAYVPRNSDGPRQIHRFPCFGHLANKKTRVTGSTGPGLEDHRGHQQGRGRADHAGNPCSAPGTTKNQISNSLFELMRNFRATPHFGYPQNRLIHAKRVVFSVPSAIHPLAPDSCSAESGPPEGTLGAVVVQGDRVDVLFRVGSQW